MGALCGGGAASKTAGKDANDKSAKMAPGKLSTKDGAGGKA